MKRVGSGPLLLLLLLVSACARTPHPRDPLDVPVESWDMVDVAPLNVLVDEAAGAGCDWPRSAVSVTLGVLGGDADARYLALSGAGNKGEQADTVVVHLARDGLLDDSVRGDWHRAVLYRVDDGTWRLRELRRAFRCWRGGSTDRYSADLCP